MKIITVCLTGCLQALLMMQSSCVVPKASEGTPAQLMDLVCNMKIADKSEAYVYKYKGKSYYFDSNTCKETFKMNPEKFINNTCNTAK
jgi:YHS domain-containing protein